MELKDMLSDLHNLSKEEETSYSWQYWSDGNIRFTIGDFKGDCDKYSVNFQMNDKLENAYIMFETEYLTEPIAEGDLFTINKFVEILTEYKPVLFNLFNTDVQ